MAGELVGWALGRGSQAKRCRNRSVTYTEYQVRSLLHGLHVLNHGASSNQARDAKHSLVLPNFRVVREGGRILRASVAAVKAKAVVNLVELLGEEA